MNDHRNDRPTSDDRPDEMSRFDERLARERFEPLDRVDVTFALDDVRGAINCLREIQQFQGDEQYFPNVYGWVSSIIWRLERAEKLLDVNGCPALPR